MVLACECLKRRMMLMSVADDAGGVPGRRERLDPGCLFHWVWSSAALLNSSRMLLPRARFSESHFLVQASAE